MGKCPWIVEICPMSLKRDYNNVALAEDSVD